MKENKFRGQLKDNNKWVYGYYVKFLVDLDKNGDPVYEHFIVENIINNRGKRDTYMTYHEVKPETVGQYTGKKDKNDKEIYEDDIVKTNLYDGSGYKIKEFIGVVEYDKLHCEYRVVSDMGYQFLGYNYKEWKKIANKHEDSKHWKVI